MVGLLFPDVQLLTGIPTSELEARRARLLEYFAANGLSGGVLFDTRVGRWQRLPSAPSGQRSSGVRGTRSALYTAFGGQLLDVVDGRWTPVPRPPRGAGLGRFDRAGVTAGLDMVIAGGYRWREGQAEFPTGVWIWRAPR